MTRATSLAGFGVLVQTVAALAQDYGRAEQRLTWNLLPRVYHDQVSPTWFPDSTRFWYRVHTRSGFQFMVVDPRAGSRAPVFDNGRLAAALSTAAGRPIDPAALPFDGFQLDSDDPSGRSIVIALGSTTFRCDLARYTCRHHPAAAGGPRLVRSPDRRWDAFVSGHNLWVRPAAGGDSIRLTDDGTTDFGYGVRSPNASAARRGLQERPELFWSPDSRRIATFRYDERQVARSAIMSLTGQRPVTYLYPFAMPGDSIVPTADVHVIEVASRSNRRIDHPPQPVASRYGGGQASLYNLGANPIVWTAGSERIYFTHADRGPRSVRLIEGDGSTGRARVVLADSSATAVVASVDVQGSAPNWRVLATGEVIFFSERDGFGHLYRFGPDGTLRNQITRGPWTVMSIVAVDERAGLVYFTATGRESGRHPDYRLLYVVALDGTGLRLLSPEEADHSIIAVPGGGFFIDSYSRINRPPVVVLRGVDGRVVRALERADISELLATGWRPGEPFSVKARDGVTELTGVLWKPSHFDSTRRYPVIDHVYPGPLFSPVDKSFFPPRDDGLSYPTMGQAQALAELGFIVVEVDAFGNLPRSKASYTATWGNMADNGIPDHVAALKQLGARFPWMDLDRVGIYGYSGGGFASTAALLGHPELYRVAVSIAGNHDNRSYNFGWGERFHGLRRRDSAAGTDNYDSVANSRLAGSLAGRLLLIHGDLDDNVHPAHTIQLVDALIKANKTFDLLIVPDAGHGLVHHPYVIRRTWDYFVRHLLGIEPPPDYRITPPQE